MPEAPVAIVHRKVNIDFDGVPAGPWFPAGGPLETLFNAASLSFPPTERFFIASVRAYLDRIDDPVLREQVRGFVHQEGMHNRVHQDCNAMLARSNPGCRRAERVSLATFAFFGRFPRAFRLSLSAALEHFTSMAADTLLHYPEEFRRIVPTEVAQMWLWHAAEETEHKAVCIDVHDRMLGRGPLAYLNRVFGMLVATPLFLFVLLLITAAFLRAGRRRQPDQPPPPTPSVSLEEFPETDAGRFLGRSALGLLRELVPWRLYFSYYRPSFHPWDYDNSHFVAEWKQRYPDFGLNNPPHSHGEVPA
jgi:predicted metal-dependent hydrolase